MKNFLNKNYFVACFGNLFEHYDMALFSFLSPFLATLIFPKEDPITALLFTYSIIPISMLARPLGALFFGYIGDRYTRKQALFLSLLGMAIISLFLTFIPTYAQIGIAAPILFLLARLLQNFCSGGETIGGAIFILEQTPKRNKDLLSSLFDSSTVAGYLVASLGVYLITQLKGQENGWRLLYAFGCMTALFGLLIRKNTSLTMEKKDFSQLIKTLPPLFKNYKGTLLHIMLVSGLSYSLAAIALVLLNGYVPLFTSFTKEEMSLLNTCLLIFDFITLPLFGILAIKFTRERLMFFASLAIQILAIPLFMMLKSDSWLQIIIARMLFVTLGVAFSAPLHAYMQELVPKEDRYKVVSMGYALGTQIIGGPTVTIALWLFKETTIISSAAWYLIFLSFISSIILFRKIQTNKEKRNFLRNYAKNLSS